VKEVAMQESGLSIPDLTGVPLKLLFTCERANFTLPGRAAQDLPAMRSAILDELSLQQGINAYFF
jgi:hypothetical protein